MEERKKRVRFLRQKSQTAFTLSESKKCENYFFIVLLSLYFIILALLIPLYFCDHTKSMYESIMLPIDPHYRYIGYNFSSLIFHPELQIRYHLVSSKNNRTSADMNITVSFIKNDQLISKPLYFNTTCAMTPGPTSSTSKDFYLPIKVDTNVDKINFFISISQDDGEKIDPYINFDHLDTILDISVNYLHFIVPVFAIPFVIYYFYLLFQVSKRHWLPLSCATFYLSVGVLIWIQIPSTSPAKIKLIVNLLFPSFSESIRLLSEVNLFRILRSNNMYSVFFNLFTLLLFYAFGIIYRITKISSLRIFFISLVFTWSLVELVLSSRIPFKNPFLIKRIIVFIVIAWIGRWISIIFPNESPLNDWLEIGANFALCIYLNVVGLFNATATADPEE